MLEKKFALAYKGLADLSHCDDMEFTEFEFYYSRLIKQLEDERNELDKMRR